MKDVNRLERSMEEIKRQKKLVLESLGHYRGRKGMRLNRVADKDLGGYLNAAEQQSKVQCFVSDKELNTLKRQNYGDMFANPKHFNTKIKKMHDHIKEADTKFVRAINSSPVKSPRKK